MKSSSSQSKSGFTLIEIMIFIAISSIILISLISTSITVTRQTQITAHKAYATRYADELTEWLRIQKELDWQAFYNTVTTSPREFCVYNEIQLNSTLTLLTLISPTTPCNYNGPATAPADRQIFRRSVTFAPPTGATSSVTGVKATVEVKWKEIGATDHVVKVESFFAPR